MARLDFKTPKKTFRILKKIKSDFQGKLILTDNDGKQYTLFDGVVDINQGQVVENQAPVVFAGDDITVKPGTPVILDGTVTDKEDAVVTNVIWKQVLTNPEDPQLQLETDTADATIVRTVAPEIREGKKFEHFEFLIEATDSGGLTGKDTCVITVTPDGKPIEPEPPGPSEGKVLWESSNPEFANGESKRVDTGSQNHYMGWKDDNIVFSHAGATREYHKDGKGGFTISGARARAYPYPDELQQHVMMTTYVTANDSLDNITLNSVSDHNEGGAIEHRHGGRQGRFGYKDQSVGFKIELYHNVHMSVNDVKLPNGIKLEFGKKQGLRTKTWVDKNGTIQLEQYIDQDADGNWEKVNSTSVKNPKPYWLGKKHYGWFRTNNDAGSPKDILFEDSKVEEIVPPS